ncbi:MAG: L-threonylcarbamoyladenylate synthase [Thermodesulfobacteriota bacterium]
MSGVAEPSILSPAELARALAVIRAGGVVAFPTETYYGLAVDPFNREALSRLFALKRRPPDKPVLTLIESEAQLPLLARQVPKLYRPLMDAFWPGPLTLVFDAVPELPVILTGYSGTVGVRISSHPMARQLVAALGQPLTATSANYSGQPAAVTPDEVVAQLGLDVDLVLEGGATAGGPGSTIVGLGPEGLVELRPGVIPFAAILERAGS